MSEPQTEAHDHPGEVCEPCWKDGYVNGQSNYTESIEVESRNATLDDVERAVEGLHRPGRSDVNYRAVLDAVKALRS